jgi:hypothetical protein
MTNKTAQEMSIKELRAAIKWRLSQMPSPTTAFLMSPTFLKPYIKYAEEITEYEDEIARRKSK